MQLPYYDEKICEFVCSIPETLLNNRQIQIEYIKRYAPDLAKIRWQAQKPFNLLNYNLNKFPLNLPYRGKEKVKRQVNKMFGKKLIQRNWELQFSGNNNRKHVHKYLVDQRPSNHFISLNFIKYSINEFYKNPTPATAHIIGILLTLSLFSIKNSK